MRLILRSCTANHIRCRQSSAGSKAQPPDLCEPGLGDPNLIIWQARFHDRIVRADHEYDAIAEYIETNPARWGQDTFNQPPDI